MAQNSHNIPDAETSNPSRNTTHMQLYRGFPGIGDHIMVEYNNATDICYWGIALELDPTTRVMLRCAEIGNKKWIKSAKALLPLNKPMVHQVYRVHEADNIIEVTGKGLQTGDVKKCNDEYAKTRKLSSMLENISNVTGHPCADLYTELIAPHIRNYNTDDESESDESEAEDTESDADDKSSNDLIDKSTNNNDTNEAPMHMWDAYATNTIIVHDKYKTHVQTYLQKTIKLDTERILTHNIKVYTYAANGVDILKKTLGQDFIKDLKIPQNKYKLKIIYSNPPNYTVEFSSKEPDITTHYNNIIANIKEKAIVNGCNISLPFHPRRKNIDELTQLDILRRNIQQIKPTNKPSKHSPITIGNDTQYKKCVSEFCTENQMKYPVLTYDVQRKIVNNMPPQSNIPDTEKYVFLNNLTDELVRCPTICTVPDLLASIDFYDNYHREI